MSRPYRLYPLRYSRERHFVDAVADAAERRPATAADLLDAPDPSAELRRLREQVAAARTTLAAILDSADRGLRGDHVASLTELHAIDEAARGGLEALR